ncbi:MAG: ATP synthase F1 subunit delta [Mycoplasmoidaceae bacterium]|nr:ATP synthase F1 subunit delta [Mycoplasmoidaceae bacterium]
MIDFNRASLLEKILREFLDYRDEYLEIVFVKVYSAFELNEQQLNKIKQALEERFHKNVAVQNYIDPDVIGGIKIESKTLSIDNTLKKKLELIKNKSLSM